MDPINPISESPEALNPTPQPPEKSKSSNLLTIISMAIFILMSLGVIVFLYYQNQQLKSMLASYQTQPSPTPTATADPTTNWKTYTTKDNYQIKYPNDWTISTIAFGFSVNQGDYKINIQTSNPGFGPGVCIFSDAPDFNNPYTDNPILATSKCPGSYVEFKGINGIFRRKSIPNTSPEGKLTGDWSVYVKDQEGNFVTVPPISYKIPIPQYNQSTVLLMDQILSTFKFTTATSSASPVPTQKACTLEAKICPDGSSVGRTGPNCEFAPCPTGY